MKESGGGSLLTLVPEALLLQVHPASVVVHVAEMMHEVCPNHAANETCCPGAESDPPEVPEPSPRVDHTGSLSLVLSMMFREHGN